MKKTILIYLSLTIFVINTIQAQVSHGGKPLPLIQSKSLFTDFFKEMDSFDVKEELRLDALNESDLRGGFKFAYKFITHFNRSNSGISFMLEDGTKVWRLGIRSKDALSINILFSEYEIPEGAQVFLYNPEQTQILGSFTSSNNSDLNILPVSPIHGEELIIEYQEPANATFPGRLTVGEVNHAYKDFRGYEPGGDRSEFYCMPSPICFQEDEQYYKIARSTVLITIDGITACSGVMVNNTSNDGKPYLLTASHCLNKNFTVQDPDYESIAGRIVCFFNYSSPTCETVMRGTEEMSVASSSFRAVNINNDMALLELLETPPVYYQPYYAGWNIDAEGGKPPYAGIHHPRASVKRINISEKDISLTTFHQAEFYKNVHWYIEEWSVGSTASGSSGSPLFDSDNHLIGALSGGGSFCDSPRDDYYYALFKAWEPTENKDEQLKNWLDPSSSDKLVLDGFDPYTSNPCYRLSNVYDLKLQENIEITELLSPANGNLFGINSLKTNEYAEEYNITGDAKLYGVYLVTPTITDPLATLEVEVTVYSGNDKPQVLIHSENFSPAYTELSLVDSSFQQTPKRLNREQENFIHFEKPVDVSGSFFIGYKIKLPDNSSFAVYNLSKGKSTKNTAWIQLDDQWVKASSHSIMPMNTSLFIDPVIQYSNGHANEKSNIENPVKIYLGSGNKTIHIILPDKVAKGLCTIYNTNGLKVFEMPVREPHTTIPVSNIHPGVYLVNVKGENFFYTQKLIF